MKFIYFNKLNTDYNKSVNVVDYLLIKITINIHTFCKRKGEDKIK